MLIRTSVLTLALLMFSCEGGNTVVEQIIEEEKEEEDAILTRITITVDDNTLTPAQVYYDSFSISSPENFIDMSESILTLQIDPPYYNISVYELSVTPRINSTKILCYTRLPHTNFWHFQTIRSSWRITSSQPTPEWTGIAWYGFTTEDVESSDTLLMNLTLNNDPVFIDSSIIVKYVPLNEAKYTPIPGTENSLQSTQSIHLLDRNFKTNIARAFRDPRNIHNFTAIFDTENMFSPSLTGSGMNYTNSARPKDAYFFFASIPE